MNGTFVIFMWIICNWVLWNKQLAGILPGIERSLILELFKIFDTQIWQRLHYCFDWVGCIDLICFALLGSCGYDGNATR
jgi:hypothetical protein